MSSAISETSRQPEGGPPPNPRIKPPRSFLARLVLDTVGIRGAQAGIVWLAVTGFCAVFAPFIASSHPYIMKADGEITYPLFRHLSAADVSIVIVAVLAIVLLCLRKLSGKLRWWLFLGLSVIAIGMSIWRVEPPKTVVYEKYREMHAVGEIDWAYYAPVRYSPSDRSRDIKKVQHPVAPNQDHLMGTEINGADVFSRMIHACRIAMSIGFISTGIALFIGVTLGGLMGYFSGIVDILGMRLVEIFSAIPSLYLLLAMAAFFPRNLYLMMAIIGLTGWVGYAVYTRAEFLKLRQQDFVQAANACGLPLWSVLFKHMLPNGITPVLVSASFGIAAAILAETTLSFLGLGLIDEPSWGQLLNQAISSGGTFNWWIAFYPGAAIFLTVFAYNLVGEAIRDAIDPRLKKASNI